MQDLETAYHDFSQETASGMKNGLEELEKTLE